MLQFASPELHDQLLGAMFQHATESIEDVQNSLTNSSLSVTQQQHVLRIARAVAAAKEAEKAKEDAAAEMESSRTTGKVDE